MTDASASPRRQGAAAETSPRRRARQAADEAAAAQARRQADLLREADARRSTSAPAQQATAVLRAVPAPAGPLPAPRREPPARPTAQPALPQRATPTAPAPTAARTSRRPGAGPGATRREAPRARLPWHLRRRFLLPVAVVCLTGSLSGLALLAASYAHVRAAGGGLSDVVLAAADAAGTADASPRTGAAPTAPRTAGSAPTARSGAARSGAAAAAPARVAPAADTTPAPPAAPAPTAAVATGDPAGDGTGDSAGDSGAQEQPAPVRASGAAPSGTPTSGAPKAGAPAAPGADAGATAAPAETAVAAPRTVHGDVTYEGFGSARSTSVDYTTHGEFDGSTGLGGRFSLPQAGSASWGSWYVAVTATDGGQAGCRIRDADGSVLVQATAAHPGDTAECAWGDQGGSDDDASGPPSDDGSG